MRPAHGVAVGVVLACALRLAVRHIDTPLPSASPAAPPTASISAHTSARLVEPAPPLSSEPPPPSGPPLSSSDGGSDRGILLARQCLALAERDPLAAMEMAVANRLQEVDPGLSANLIAHWAIQDFQSAYEWTKAQEPGAARNDMLGRLAYLRAQADPVAAARIVATDISAGHAQDEAAMSVIHQWALRDARGAGKWAQSIPDEPLRQRAIAEVAALAAAPSPAIPIR